ncbi:MAG: septum formation protein Maf [Clostridia bacterium]|nr:septum formation protein Maf [Clostridia bacterium]
MRIILASKSPRRREILGALGKELGFEFDIVTEEVDEDIGDIHPREGVRMLAERKGAPIAKRYPDALVISSDTLVELDGTPLGKPTDRIDAIRMLKALSGRGHNVHTGVAVTYKGRVWSQTATTEVVFRALTDEEIINYVDTGEPMDKAGAYGIQGAAGVFVDGYNGDYDTVVGFNVVLLKAFLKEAVGGIEELGRV